MGYSYRGGGGDRKRKRQGEIGRAREKGGGRGRFFTYRACRLLCIRQNVVVCIYSFNFHFDEIMLLLHIFVRFSSIINM